MSITTTTITTTTTTKRRKMNNRDTHKNIFWLESCQFFPENYHPIRPFSQPNRPNPTLPHLPPEPLLLRFLIFEQMAVYHMKTGRIKLRYLNLVTSDRRLKALSMFLLHTIWPKWLGRGGRKPYYGLSLRKSPGRSSAIAQAIWIALAEMLRDWRNSLQLILFLWLLVDPLFFAPSSTIFLLLLISSFFFFLSCSSFLSVRLVSLSGDRPAAESVIYLPIEARRTSSPPPYPHCPTPPCPVPSPPWKKNNNGQKVTKKDII